MLDPYQEVMSPGTFNHCTLGSLHTFEAFIQYQEYADFVKAMESLRQMQLMLKGKDGKSMAYNIKIMFEDTEYFSEGAIRKRKQDRLKLQELEEEREKEKNQLEEERKRKEEEKLLQEKKRKTKIKRKVQKQKSEEKYLKKKTKAEDPKAEEACILKCEVKKKEPNPLNLLCQKTTKKMSKKKSYEWERNLNTQTQMKDSSDSSCYCLDDSAEGEDFDNVIPNLCKYDFFSQLNSLQITIKPDRSQVIQSIKDDDEEDEHIWNASSNPCGRKQKIYETDEFFHYLLNYYHPPKYARFYDYPKSAISKYIWKREVRVCENGIQFGFNQPDHHVMQNGQKFSYIPEDNWLWKSVHQEREPRSRGSVNTICAEDCHYTDPSNEAVDLTSNAGRKYYPWKNSYIDPIKDFRYWSKRKSSSQCLIDDSSIKVADYLEEISSDSDCFNEILNETSRHQSLFPNTSCFVKVRESSDDYSRAFTFEQEKKCDQCGICPKPLKSKFKKTVKRSSNDLKWSGECETNGVEKNTRKKKKLLVENSLEKNDYPESDPSSSLRKPEKKRSKGIESKMKCKASCVPMASSRSVYVPSVQDLSENMDDDPWMLESDENTGAFKRYVQWDDETLSDHLTRFDNPDFPASENGFERSSVFNLQSF